MKSENEMEMKDELIARYLSGEATPEEAMELMDWVQDPVNALYFEQLESIWNATYAVTKAEFNKQKAWNKVGDGAIPNPDVHSSFFGFAKPIWRIAASLLIVAVSGIFLYVSLSKEEIKNTTLFSTYEPKATILADQSKITLFRHSTLSYRESFNTDEREVNLIQGEAFFEIHSDALKPFVVHTAIADVKVIGTTFNVTLTNNQVEISVKEGKVMVFNANDSVYLTKGSTGIVKSGNTITTNDNADDNNWAYATHQLVFKNAPLKSVIRDIEKTYACSIRVSQININNCNLTATFDNDSVDKIVDLIAESLNLSLKKNGSVFTLEGEGCP